MGLFDKLFPAKVEQTKQLNGFWQTLTAYTPTFVNWQGSIYESELVRSAIDARARHISKLKIEVEGSAKPYLRTRLKQGPNDFQTWSQFLYRTSTILDVNNTAFIVPILGKYLETIGYFSVLPSECKILADEHNNPWLRYTFLNGKTAAIELQRVGILTKFQYKDDVFGSDNYALNPTMELIQMQNQGITEAIKNSATYRFMAQANNFAKAEDLAKERKRFSNENFSSKSSAGGLLLFPNTYTNIQQIKNSPYTVDAEQMAQIHKNVYNYFGVNEDVLQSKAIGDSWNAFYESVIETFAIQLSEVLTKMTFTSTERSYGAEIMVTSNRLQYMSNTDKLQVTSQMADRGIMTINEIRDIWNLPPVENGDVRPVRGEYYDMAKGKDDKQIEENNESENEDSIVDDEKEGQVNE